MKCQIDCKTQNKNENIAENKQNIGCVQELSWGVESRRDHKSEREVKQKCWKRKVSFLRVDSIHNGNEAHVSTVQRPIWKPIESKRLLPYVCCANIRHWVKCESILTRSLWFTPKINTTHTHKQTEIQKYNIHIYKIWSSLFWPLCMRAWCLCVPVLHVVVDDECVQKSQQVIKMELKYKIDRHNPSHIMPIKLLSFLHILFLVFLFYHFVHNTNT